MLNAKVHGRGKIKKQISKHYFYCDSLGKIAKKKIIQKKRTKGKTENKTLYMWLLNS